MLQPEGRKESELLATYRTRFRQGPVGVWHTWLGAGWDSCYGCQFTFRKDYTGLAYTWDIGDDKEPETEEEFTWRLVSDFTIDIQPVGERRCEEDWGIVRYDFAFGLAKCGGDRKLFLYEIGHYGKTSPGFWWSPNPVVFADENPQHIYIFASE